MAVRAFLLVTGPMRSGTTLMGELLYSRYLAMPRHPELSFANDTVSLVRDFSARARRDTVPPVALMDTRRPIPVPDGEGSSLWSRLVEAVTAAAPLAEPPSVIGVKTTCLLGESALLRQILPVPVSTVLMLRDPRDVFASTLGRNRKLPGMTPEDALGTAAMNTAFLMNYHAALSASGRLGDALVIRYEDLIADVEGHIRRILAMVGLSAEQYDFASIQAGKVPSNSSRLNIGPDDAEPMHGIDPSSRGSFRTMLSPDEIRLVECMTGPFMDAFGYPRMFAPDPGHDIRIMDSVAPLVTKIAHEHGYFLEPLSPQG
ncbi:sulfotransferase [Azospirillum sp. B21]|uniref:sulfotransferase family protein n=1 Tax=Azospirillum sp. B21 TaxID=2607496 RepID=UPI0011EE3717|nr:sulfotransferase [Azospirillum sp. B21]KAA0577871.1 sulfotransferase [Azospirillum sp. B21]